MPVLHEKWMSAPLGVIKELFQRREDGGLQAVQKFFEEKLRTGDDFASIPFLSSVSFDKLHDGCLVRYIAMIQDQFDPEFYFKVYHTLNSESPQCGLYSDPVYHPGLGEVNWDHPSNVMDDRQTLYCVPIPAESQWVKEIRQTLCNIAEVESTSTHLKRKYTDFEGDTAASVSMEEDAQQGGSTGELHTKKQCLMPTTGETSSHLGHDLNFPIPGEEGLPCLVKLYRDFDKFGVGTMIEVVGVLATDPALAPLSYSGDQHQLDTAAERKVHCPPPSLVPRLHAIMVRPLLHSNPLLPVDLSFPVQADSMEMFQAAQNMDIEKCRTVLIDMLTQVFSGDSLAAEYTLLHLLSSVYGRMEVMALGKYSLNLSKSSGQILSQTLYQLFHNLLTKCFLLPLTLDNMNLWRFTPKKDYNSNRLLSSVLQLSPGTHVLVDETVLTAGQLTQVGVANLTALGNVIQWQRLSYDFQFHSAEFDCDLPVLVLSEGKSMLKVDCHVPLLPMPPSVEAPAQSPLDLDEMTQLRCYVSLCRGLEYSLTPYMQTTLEKEFVTMRGNNPELNGEQFHHLLCTARLVSLSFGCQTLSPQLWEHTRQLEKQRLERIKNMV